MILTDLTLRLSETWTRLEKEGQEEGLDTGRIYQRLEVGNETGFRVSCIFPDRELELLIAVQCDKEGYQYRFPDWKGMVFSVVSLDVPDPGTKHISLRLRNQEYKEVFISLCGNLANCLGESAQQEREFILACFLDRWTRFFANSSTRGLSSEQQRGLFGELKWFQILLEKGLPFNRILVSWKGPEGNSHDYDFSGYALEVKTTLMKEPRKVRISSEKQLDAVGLHSLFLFVATLNQTDGGGETLSDLVLLLRSHALKIPGAAIGLENKLVGAGYNDLHKDKYTNTFFTVRKRELFHVTGNFPRITEVPAGIGDLRYSLVVGALSSFEVEIADYTDQIRETAYGI